MAGADAEKRGQCSFSRPQLLGLLATCVIVSVCVAGGVLVAVEANVGTKKKESPSELEELGFPAAIGIKPWALEQSGCPFAMTLISVFLLRVIVIPRLIRLSLPDCPAEKREKVGNYVLEVLMTSTGFCVLLAFGYWEILFDKEARDSPTADQAYRAAAMVQWMYAIVCSSYVLEMAFDKHMRMELMVHHFTTIFLGFVSLLAIGFIGGDMYLARQALTLSLYIVTEGPVFMMLLLYQFKFYQWVVYELNAVLYLATRVAVAALCFWVWWPTRMTTFEIHEHNSFIVYGIFLINPLGVLILSVTQLAAVMNLFGLARRVQSLGRRAKVRARLRALFGELCKGGEGLSRADWLQHAGNACLGVALPAGGLESIFDKMDVETTGTVVAEQFVVFFEPLSMNAADNAALLKILLLMAVMEDEAAHREKGHIMSELKQLLGPYPASSGGGGCRGQRQVSLEDYVQKKVETARKVHRPHEEGIYA